MRPLVVKRQITPISGFFSFFRFFLSCWRSRHLATCPDLISVCWCTTNVAAPNLIEVLSPRERRLQRPPSLFSATWKLICALVPSYSNARINGEPFSSQVQARVRNSTREPLTTIAI